MTTSPAYAVTSDQFAAAVKAFPVGFMIADATQPDYPVIFVNSAFTAITGYSAEETLGRNPRFLQGPATDPVTCARVARALAEAQPVTVEMINYRKSGEPFWMSVEINPIFDGQGRLGQFVASLTDVTGRRVAEEVLRENEERLRGITRAIPLPMMVIQPDRVIADANSMAEEVLGVPSIPGLPGRNILDFAVDPDRCEEFRQELERVGSMQRIEMQLKRADGMPFWVLGSAQVIAIRGHIAYLFVFQDLTGQKQKEVELTEAKEQAERLIRSKMRFFAAASHDLRQPLQALALFASALETHVQPGIAQTILSSIKASLRSMEDMFEALLDMSRLDAGVLKAEPTTFLINDLLERIEDEFSPQAEAAGLRLRVSPSSVAVCSDPSLLARILRNFVTNAIRYTPSGGILVGCRRRGRNLRIEVRDTGPGIPESQRQEIFEEFYQGDRAAIKSSGTRGLGLGLAIVQRLARLLGHPLDVRSAEGKGSVFAVEVLMAEDWESGDGGEEEHAAPRDIAGAVILVIDDDQDILEGLRMMFDEWRCVPLTATTAEEALLAIDRSGLKPQVILADLWLRNQVSGIAAVRTVFERLGGEVPAFLFTGDTELKELQDQDIDFPVLRKPINPQRLRAVLADTLEHIDIAAKESSGKG